jgi:hypothetical protein
MRPHEDYRDETASLVAENERLRAELERHRGPGRRTAQALALIASDFAAVLLLRPWFNGESDAKFWGAVAISVALAAAAIAYVLMPAAGPRR